MYFSNPTSDLRSSTGALRSNLGLFRPSPHPSVCRSADCRTRLSPRQRPGSCSCVRSQTGCALGLFVFAALSDMRQPQACSVASHCARISNGTNYTRRAQKEARRGRTGHDCRSTRPPVVREAIKEFPARCASIRTGLASTIIPRRERRSLAIARSSFTVLPWHEFTITRAALELRRRGFQRVRPLAGGLQAWHERGFP